MVARPKHGTPERGRKKVKLPPGVRIPVRYLDGSTLTSADSVQRWYELPGRRWSFMSDEQRSTRLRAIQVASAALGGCTATRNERTRGHLRVTTRPYDVARWAKDYDATVQTHSTPPDAQAWEKHLTLAQQAMAGRLNLGDAKVYLGIKVADRSLWAEAAEKAGASKAGRAVADAVRQVNSAMAMPGLDGAPVDPAELEWLIHRSYGLHMPAPVNVAAGEPMTPEDMPTFTDAVDIEEVKGGRCVRLVSRGPKPVVRYVTVLSMGRQRNDELDIPGDHMPWMAYARLLSFSVEISAHVEFLTGEQALGAVKGKLDGVRDKLLQKRKHGLEETEQERVVEGRAVAVRHDMENGNDVRAGRVVGQVRFAISGKDEEEVAARETEFKAHYRKYQIDIHRPRAQRALLEEFVPGSKPATTAHTRHMQHPFWAAALPTLDSSIGSKAGYYLGWTLGASKRAMCWDPWEALYSEQTGLCPVIGELGSGKSYLMGLLIVEAARRGVRSTVLDPSGTLARLKYVPDLAAYTQHVDLLKAPAGTLNPWTVIPEANRRDFEDEDAWRLAQVEVEIERTTLAQDVVKMLLPPTYLRQHTATVVVRNAVDKVGGGWNKSLKLVIEELRRMSLDQSVFDRNREMAADIADELDGLSRNQLARLFYGSSDLYVDRALDSDARLLILTMPGLTLPIIGSDPETWTTGERIALPLMHLAAQLASKRAYGGDREAPKLLAIDEAHFIAQYPAGRALFTRLVRDSRKWRLRVLAGSQLPGDVLGQTVGGLTVECFVGRIESPDAQVEALKMLRVPPSEQFRNLLGELSPFGANRSRARRQFLFRDAQGRVEVFTVDCPDSDVSLALSTDQPIPQEWLGRARRFERVAA